MSRGQCCTHSCTPSCILYPPPSSVWLKFIVKIHQVSIQKYDQFKYFQDCYWKKCVYQTWKFQRIFCFRWFRFCFYFCIYWPADLAFNRLIDTYRMTVFLVDGNLFHNADFLKLTRALHTSIFSVSWSATGIHDRQKNLCKTRVQTTVLKHAENHELINYIDTKAKCRHHFAAGVLQSL